MQRPPVLFSTFVIAYAFIGGLLLTSPCFGLVTEQAAAAYDASYGGVALYGELLKKEGKLDPGYYVFVATKKTERESQLLMSDIALLGLRGCIEVSGQGQKVGFRVLSGPFQNLESAEKARIKIETNSLGGAGMTIEDIGRPKPTPTATPRDDDY